MKTLILATDDTAAGCLKASGLAERVIGIDYRLVTGPVPPIADPLTFFAEREKLGGSELPPRWDGEGAGWLCDRWRDMMDVVHEVDRTEIWADPERNSQLLLVQLLDCLGAQQGLIEKMSLVNADFRIGSRSPEYVAGLGLRAEKVSDIQLQTARLALRAFQQPTPEAWAALLRERLQGLPHLRSTVDSMLDELPAADTALTVSETRLLELISTGRIRPPRVFGDYFRETSNGVLDYWELGERLHGLAHCQVPPILGVPAGPFNLALHDDRDRYARYKRSKLS